MLAGRRSAVANDKLVHFRRELENDSPVFGTGKVHEWNDVEISVPDVPRDRIENAALFKKGDEFGQEARIGVGVDDEVVDEWGRVEAAQVLPEEREALAPDLPVFLGGALVFRDTHRDAEVGKRAFRLFRFPERLSVGMFREFGQEHEFRHAAPKHHADLRQESEAEAYRLQKSHLTQYLREEAHGEPEGVVVIGLERFGGKPQEAVDDIRQDGEVGEKDDQHGAFRLRARSGECISILLDKLVYAAVDASLKRSELFLFFKFRFREGTKGCERTVSENNLKLLHV